MHCFSTQNVSSHKTVYWVDHLAQCQLRKRFCHYHNKVDIYLFKKRSNKKEANPFSGQKSVSKSPFQSSSPQLLWIIVSYFSLNQWFNSLFHDEINKPSSSVVACFDLKANAIAVSNWFAFDSLALPIIHPTRRVSYGESSFAKDVLPMSSLRSCKHSDI